MSDLMTFPDSVEEFMERYKIVDTDGIYMSKGAELVPIFRMRQWFEHLPSARRTGRWIYNDEAYPGGNPYGHYECDQCGEYVPHKTNYCPNCGCAMEGEEE